MENIDELKEKTGCRPSIETDGDGYLVLYNVKGHEREQVGSVYETHEEAIKAWMDFVNDLA